MTPPGDAHTGLHFVGSGLPYSASTTGTVVGVPTSYPSPEIRLGDGLHDHDAVVVHLAPAKIQFQRVSSPTIASPLEIAIVFVALVGVLATSSATVSSMIAVLMAWLKTWRPPFGTIQLFP